MHAPLSPAYRVEWRSLGVMAPLAEPWGELAGRALEPNVFYEPGFALAAAPVLGDDAGVALVWRRGRLAGLFPARIARRRYGACGAVIAWTHPYAPLGVPLVDRDDAVGVIGAWLDHLAGDPAMPGLLLMPFVPETGAFASALDEALGRRGLHSAWLGRHRRAMLAPGARREGYVERAVSAGRRKELRRQRRRLEDVAPVTFSTVTAPSDVGRAVEDFLVIEASGWKGLAGSAAALDPGIRTFMETAVLSLARSGKARVDRMHLNATVIAASITLMSGGVAWCWKIAYSEGVARASPGVQLAIELTRSLLADPRIQRADSCATADHPMIDHIWRERLAMGDRLVALRPNAAAFALARGAETLGRRVRSTARTLRDRLRG